MKRLAALISILALVGIPLWVALCHGQGGHEPKFSVAQPHAGFEALKQSAAVDCCAKSHSLQAACDWLFNEKIPALLQTTKTFSLAPLLAIAVFALVFLGLESARRSQSQLKKNHSLSSSTFARLAKDTLFELARIPFQSIASGKVRLRTDS